MCVSSVRTASSWTLCFFSIPTLSGFLQSLVEHNLHFFIVVFVLGFLFAFVLRNLSGSSSAGLQGGERAQEKRRVRIISGQ